MPGIEVDGKTALADCPKCDTRLLLGPPRIRVYVTRAGANTEERAACPKCDIVLRLHRGQVRTYGRAPKVRPPHDGRVILAELAPEPESTPAPKPKKRAKKKQSQKSKPAPAPSPSTATASQPPQSPKKDSQDSPSIDPEAGWGPKSES